MPSSYLIKAAARQGRPLAPWDLDVPILPPLGEGVEDRRHLKIENFVTTSSSSCSKLRDLNKKHALSYSNGKSKKKVGSKFSSVRFKSTRPSATTLVFGSGNQVHAGTKSYSQALLAHYTFITIISDLLGTKSTQAERFRIQNIVASCHYGYEIDLEKLSKERAEEFSWDPKLFPGARGKVQGLKTVTLLFASGNGVITGAKTEEEIVRAFHRTYHIVKKYFGKKSEPHRQKGKRYKRPEIPDHLMENL